jgi:hypothetical protein
VNANEFFHGFPAILWNKRPRGNGEKSPTPLLQPGFSEQTRSEKHTGELNCQRGFSPFYDFEEALDFMNDRVRRDWRDANIRCADTVGFSIACESHPQNDE